MHADRDVLLAMQQAISKLPKVDTIDIVKPIVDGLLLMLDPDSGSGAHKPWGGSQCLLALRF
jgi:hypothetical protein